MSEDVAIFWSGGKDSALAMYKAIGQGYNVRFLITTFSVESERVTMHGIKKELIEAQSASSGIPLMVMQLDSSDHSDYESKFSEVLKSLKDEGITKVVFGDIHLEDLKMYRDRLLNENGCIGIYPLWQTPDSDILNMFFENGFKALICAANSKFFSAAGNYLDKEFIESLKLGVDKCGENGEYHSFVYLAPYFKEEIQVRVNSVVKKAYVQGSLSETFWFADLKLK